MDKATAEARKRDLAGANLRVWKDALTAVAKAGGYLE